MVKRKDLFDDRLDSDLDFSDRLLTRTFRWTKGYLFSKLALPCTPREQRRHTKHKSRIPVIKLNSSNHVVQASDQCVLSLISALKDDPWECVAKNSTGYGPQIIYMDTTLTM